MIRRVILSLSLLLAVTLAVGAWQAVQVRASLDDGRQALLAAEAHAREGEIGLIGNLLEDASTRFAAASGRTRGLLWRALGAIPILGGNARAVADIVAAGQATVGALEEVLEAARAFPARDGTVTYTGADGRIDPEPWREAAVHLRAAEQRADHARATLIHPRRLLLPQISSAYSEAAERVAQLADAIQKAATLSEILPAMLGGGDPREYLLVVQNPAESRATGGLAGGFGIIEVERGEISLTDVQSNRELPDAAVPLDMPAWFEQRYGRFAVARQWNNSNMHPNFEVTGGLQARMFEDVTGVRVDGVITTDLVALGRLLDVVGPLEGPGGFPLDPATFEQLALIDQYEMFPDRVERQKFMESVGVTIWREALKELGSREMLSEVGDIAAERRLAIWSRDEDEQRALRALDVSGKFIPDGPARFMGVVTQNASPSKLDTFLRREIRTEISRSDDGLRLVGTVTLHNEADPEDLPDRVLVPERYEIAPGENRTYLSIFLPQDAGVERMNLDGERIMFEAARLPNAHVVSTHVLIPAGEARTIQMEWIEPAPARGSRFAFVFPRQPVVQADTVQLEVTKPLVLDAGGNPSPASFVDRTEREVAVEIQVRAPGFWERVWRFLTSEIRFGVASAPA